MVFVAEQSCTGDRPCSPYKISGGARGGVRRVGEAGDGEAFPTDLSGEPLMACDDVNQGTGKLSGSADCLLDFSACSVSDFGTAAEWYDDDDCDACELLGGARDSQCDTPGAEDRVCADYFHLLAGVWTCQHITGRPDPDCEDLGFAGGSMDCRLDGIYDLSGCNPS